MGLQCRPIKCADLHLPVSSRGIVLWEEGVGVHPAITELPLCWGKFEEDSHHHGQRHTSSGSNPTCRSCEQSWRPALTMILPSRQTAQAMRLVLAPHEGQVVWGGVTPRLPFILFLQRHWHCFLRGGAGNTCSPPGISTLCGVSLQWVKSWHCHHLLWGRGFTQPVVGTKQTSCLH